MKAIEIIRHRTFNRLQITKGHQCHAISDCGWSDPMLCAYAQDGNTKRKNKMNDYKEQATLWYEAFSKKDPRSSTESERGLGGYSSSPGTPAGPSGVKPLLAILTTTFPDLNLTIKDILQDGNKGRRSCRNDRHTQETFMGLFHQRTGKEYSGRRHS